jgi:hypothetical protein
MSANKKIVISSLAFRAPDKGSRNFLFMPKQFGHFGKILTPKKIQAV